ncbi:MAG: hypothetical protein EOP86_09140 [Verrucomicrobiaceae bacterium]|nr:MAG: hypothetical protein EOP86_09140 [Verrucomicrobiaceae bacterium]
MPFFPTLPILILPALDRGGHPAIQTPRFLSGKRSFAPAKEAGKWIQARNEIPARRGELSLLRHFCALHERHFGSNADLAKTLTSFQFDLNSSN